MFIKNLTIESRYKNNRKIQGEQKMNRKIGKIRFVIGPTRNNGDYLYCLLKDKFPSSHLYFDGYFIYLTTYNNHSYALLKRIKDMDEVKSVFLDEEINLEKNIRSFDNSDTVEKVNSPEISARIKIIPSKETNHTLLFEALFSSFPNNFISMTDNYLLLTGKTKKISELISKIIATPGVAFAHNA